ncbi:MAG: type IV secretory system conjugative DNA transfer family protein [Acetobacteraceae bacterium]|nr:type IV secretory system conjugative DNA transfer family protein [Acetobacteraceae bacterium]
MIGRLAGGGLAALARVALRLWPLWAFAGAWWGAHWLWEQYLLSFRAAPGRIPEGYAFAWHAWPAATLAGPALLGLLAVALHRAGLVTRTAAIAGLAGVLLAVGLTVWPEWQRLGPYVGRVPPLNILGAVNMDVAWAALLGVAAFAGGAGWLRQPSSALLGGGIGGAPALVRARSDNHGHADWLTMREARRLFPGPDDGFGGIVVGEAYRVDRDRGAGGRPFDPADTRTWGRGGRAPLLVDPCRTGPTHALAFAGSGGFKTVSLAIPTLLTWTGSAVVLDPSREVGPMLADHRAKRLHHGVVTLDPTKAGGDCVDALDWIDTVSPLAEGHVEAVVGWITGEPPRTRAGAPAGGAGEFFRDAGRSLVACLLADLLWNPTVAKQDRTLRELRARVAEPEKALRERLGTIHDKSASRMAKELAGSLKDLVPETFSGVYANAGQATRWLSVPAYADLVSGGPEGRYAPARKTLEVTKGKLTVFVQVPLEVLQTTPSLARVLVGALLNAAYRADGAVEGRVLFLLDEAARLGPMALLETARDAGRKYGITLLLLYQSLGQLRDQWGEAGKQAWFDGTSWRLFAAVQDPETAREVSALCGEHGVVATSEGDTRGTQGRLGLGMAGAASASSGRSENRSELRRALIKPDELIQDTRADEAFVFARGARPLRCGRAIWFRRPEWRDLVGKNRFHPGAGPPPAAPLWSRLVPALGHRPGPTG